MTRPEYETADDIAREQLVRDRIAKWRKCQMIKTPAKYPLDFAMERNGKITGFGEIKCRNNLMDEYGTYMISLHKVMAARQISEATGLPSILFVEWSGGNLGYMLFDTKPDHVSWGGRGDRADPQDMEPCCFYNVDEKFTLVLEA